MESHQKIAASIKEVWERKDYELLREYLADPVEWREGPFQEALKTPEEVVQQWHKDLEGQSNVRAEIEVLAVVGSQGSYHFGASWQDSSRGATEIDGIFLIRLNLEGKIKYFNQWYMLKTE